MILKMLIFKKKHKFAKMSLESGVLGVFDFFGVFGPLDLKNGSAVQSPASQAVSMVPILCRNALFIAREPVLFF